MEDFELRRQILLAFQVALLGMISPHLRGVTVGWDSSSIAGIFFYDGFVSDADEEVVSDVEAEIIASFPNFTINLKAKRHDQSKSLSDEGFKAWVYCRME